MKCKACGRILKNVESKSSGYGPVCYRKMFGRKVSEKCKVHNSEPDRVTYIKIPGQMEVSDYLQIIGEI